MQTNQNPSGRKFGNRTAYCDFQRYGNGEAGFDVAPDDACRIHNVPSLLWNGRQQLTADQFLRSEINNCDPCVWPTVRSPAEQLRLALNAAERIYRSHLAARKVVSCSQFLDSARAAYQRCRRERGQWARGKTTLLQARCPNV